MKLHRMPCLIHEMIIAEMGFRERFSNYEWVKFTWNNKKVIERERTKNAGIMFEKLLRHLKRFSNIQKPVFCKIEGAIPIGFISQLDCESVYDVIDIRTEPIASVTLEDLTILLENMKIELLRLNVGVPSVRGYKYLKNPEKERSIDNLEIRNYSWVDFSEMPSAKTIYIEAKIQQDEINAVLRSWIAGKNREMEFADFELGKFSDTNREIIFTDVETHASQLTEEKIESCIRRAKKLPDSLLVHNIIAMDILRENYLLRATVIDLAALPPRRAKCACGGLE
ncbi:hypothetical protein B9Z55_003285 [Caenorhabditis nigoni]|uniref:F-box associated domain-containing protein n=1 Tax=Caenorhabditis nigoni TaxID=1611254 RepID=A0A2G5VPC9_9PELO|nr:hypothetical protein B9Z55_003285 [Caenorhabditis nigoni]